MLEAIVGVGGQALHQHDVRVCELFEGSLQRRILHAGDIAQQAVGKITADYLTDLRYFARRAEAIESCHQPLLKRRRNALDAGLVATLQ